jgi:hypothetical protein
MPNRSSNRKTSDPNVAAFGVMQHVIAMSEGRETPATPEKNPAAVALGRLGGLKGGKARAKKLSAKRRTAIAKKAARVRWSAKRRGWVPRSNSGIAPAIPANGLRKRMGEEPPRRAPSEGTPT